MQPALPLFTRPGLFFYLFCVDSYSIPINSILLSDYTIQHEVGENEELIADVETGDTIVLRDAVYGPSNILVRKIEWMSYAPLVTINGEMMFAKDDWVEIAK